MQHSRDPQHLREHFTLNDNQEAAITDAKQSAWELVGDSIPREQTKRFFDELEAKLIGKLTAYADNAENTINCEFRLAGNLVYCWVLVNNDYVSSSMFAVPIESEPPKSVIQKISDWLRSRIETFLRT